MNLSSWVEASEMPYHQGRRKEAPKKMVRGDNIPFFVSKRSMAPLDCSYPETVDHGPPHFQQSLAPPRRTAWIYKKFNMRMAGRLDQDRELPHGSIATAFFMTQKRQAQTSV
jgi:hypothetical protein